MKSSVTETLVTIRIGDRRLEHAKQPEHDDEAERNAEEPSDDGHDVSP